MLPFCEFRKPPRDLILLLTLILLLLVLNRLVLVLHLVELKLEQVGQFLLLLTAALTLTAASRHLNVTEDGFGTQELLQRTLLGRKRFFGLFSFEFVDSGGHFLCSLPDILHKFRKVRFGVKRIAEPSPDALDKVLCIRL